MGEVWAAAVATVAGGVIAGKAAEKKDKGDKAHQQAMTREESALAAQRTGYESALEEWYTQRQRQRTQRGLDQFRQFSTVNQFAPQYDAGSEVRIDPGEAPKYDDYAPDSLTQEQAAEQKRKRSLPEKLFDPLGLF